MVANLSFFNYLFSTELYGFEWQIHRGDKCKGFVNKFFGIFLCSWWLRHSSSDKAQNEDMYDFYGSSSEFSQKCPLGEVFMKF